MKIEVLKAAEAFKAVNPECIDNQVIERGYVGDLLSWVMANAEPGCAWITIQTHLNTVAVATLLEMACIIIPEGAEIEADALAKATEEGIPVFSTELNAFEVCAWLAEQDVK